MGEDTEKPSESDAVWAKDRALEVGFCDGAAHNSVHAATPTRIGSPLDSGSGGRDLSAREQGGKEERLAAAKGLWAFLLRADEQTTTPL